MRVSDTFISIHSKICLLHHFNIYMCRNEKMPIKAYDVGLNGFAQAMVGSIGEFFEREVLVNANSIAFGEKLNSLNFLKGEIETIECDKIVFFQKFVDSCGMASHYNSKDAIKGAFFEFYERQCLLLSYLSEQKAVKVNNVRITENTVLNMYDQYIRKFVDAVDYFNISINKNLCVVIAIGLGTKHNAVGLGTNTRMTEAILKAQKEILQYFSTAKFKHNVEEYKAYDNNEDKDLYHSNFMKLQADDIFREYHYLYNSKQENIEPYQGDKDIYKLMRNISKECKMEPRIVMIPSFRMIPNLKIVKIYDLSWFPHMNIKMFNEDIFTTVERKTGLKLRRDKKILPFA